MNFFNPEDFWLPPGNEFGRLSHSSLSIVQIANAKLEKEGRVVYAALSRTWFESKEQCQGHEVNKALLICVEPIEKCTHPKDSVKTEWNEFYKYALFECKCGKSLQPTAFEEIPEPIKPSERCGVESLEDGLTNKQRLEEIEEQWSATRDLDKIWLITRVKKLTEALEYIANSSPGPEQKFELENKRAAQKALKESE